MYCILEFLQKNSPNLIKKVRVKVTHAGIRGREERRGSVNEREGVRQSESVWEKERGSVLDGVMSSHMQQKQIEHQTEALLRDMLSPNSVVTFTQQGNQATTHADTSLDVLRDSSRTATVPDVQSCIEDAILVSFGECMELILEYTKHLIASFHTSVWALWIWFGIHSCLNVWSHMHCCSKVWDQEDF